VFGRPLLLRLPVQERTGRPDVKAECHTGRSRAGSAGSVHRVRSWARVLDDRANVSANSSGGSSMTVFRRCQRTTV
jgi:hypothetical protein